MIPKIHKLELRKKTDFFINCNRYYSKYFQIFYRRNHDDENTRIVVVIPKKTVKLRVSRVKIKRQVYNLYLPFLRKSKGLEIVFVANKKIINVEQQELIDDLSKIYSQLNFPKK